MSTNKLTSQMATIIEHANSDDLLDIVVELKDQPESRSEKRSRTERIAERKETFLRKVTPLEETIHQLGGEITGRAWINQSVRARMPADKIRELSKLDAIALLDVPHQVTAEAS